MSIDTSEKSYFFIFQTILVTSAFLKYDQRQFKILFCLTVPKG